MTKPRRRIVEDDGPNPRPPANDLWYVTMTFEAYVHADSPADALATLKSDLGVVDEVRVKEVRATRMTPLTDTPPPPPGGVTPPPN